MEENKEQDIFPFKFKHDFEFEMKEKKQIEFLKDFLKEILEYQNFTNLKTFTSMVTHSKLDLSKKQNIYEFVDELPKFEKMLIEITSSLKLPTRIKLQNKINKCLIKQFLKLATEVK